MKWMFILTLAVTTLRLNGWTTVPEFEIAAAHALTNGILGTEFWGQTPAAFEDNGETTGAGYFGDSQVHEDSNWKNVRWVRVPGWYNDCVMRKAVDQVNPKPYSLIGNVFTRKEQYNCQDYADDLRAKYRELMRDKKVRCECKVDEKGRKK